MAHTVICCYCGNQFDRDKEEWGHPKKELNSNEENIRRYAHKDCGEKNNWIPVKEFTRKIKEEQIKEEAEKNGRSISAQKKKQKKCLYCNKLIDVDVDNALQVGIGTRWAHKECYEKYFKADDKWIDKIYAILKVVFGDYNFQKIESQRISYIK